MSATLQGIGRTIEAIYAAASSPGESWDDALGRLAELTRARWLSLHRGADDSGASYGAEVWGIDPAHFDAYRDYYWQVESWRDEALTLPVGSVTPLAEFAPLGELERGEYHADFFEPADGYDSWLGILDRSAHWQSGLAMVRGRHDPRIDAEDLELGRVFLPHMRRALRVERTLRMQTLAAPRRLGGGPRPIALLDRSERLVAASAPFEQLLEAGEVLCVVSGRVVPACSSDREIWRARLREARDPGRGALEPDRQGEWFRACDRSGNPALALRALPVLDPAGLGIDRGACALVEAVDPLADGRPVADPLRALYDLTPREVRVAEEVARGRSTEQIADALAIRRNTVRVYLRQIFDKTGSRRRTELANLVWRTGAAFSNGSEDLVRTPSPDDDQG